MTEKHKEIIQKFAALGGLVILSVAFSQTSDAFFTLGNGMTIALQTTSIAYIGIGVTCVIITGGIDLSVGSVLAFSGVVAGLLTKGGMPVPLAMLGGIGIGGLCGLVSGLIVTRMKLPPFIATLGMMMVARGITLQITGAKPVSSLGEAFGILGTGALFKRVEEGADGFPIVHFPGIPYAVVLMFVIAFVMALVLTKTPFGRHLYAVGSNEEAARLSGVNVNRVKIGAYTLSGALAGLSGCVLMSRLVSAQPNEGIGYEMDAIASAVIGGTSLMGGVGSISGTVIGSFVIGILRNGLNMNGVSSFTQQIVIGLVIIGTVWIDQLRNKK